MAEVIPFPQGRPPQRARWGKAGQRLTPAPERVKQGRGQVSAAARQAVQAAKEAHAAGQVLPWRITTALNSRGLYGPEVDAACGVEEPAVDLWEKGKLYPTWEQLRLLAGITGYPIGYFSRPGEPVDPEDTSLAIHERAKLGARYVAAKPPVLAFTAQALVNAGILPGTPDTNGSTQHPLF